MFAKPPGINADLIDVEGESPPPLDIENSIDTIKESINLLDSKRTSRNKLPANEN